MAEKSKNQSPKDEAQKPVSEPESAELQSDGEEKAAKGQSHWRRWHRFVNWYKTDKRRSIPLTVLVLILLLAALPWSRYHTAGLVLKKDLSLSVTDSTAHTPVSGALVSLGSARAITDGSGKVTLHQVPVGPRTVLIFKKYYQDKQVSVLVPILSQKTSPPISLVATGRQAKVIAANLITNQKLSGVDIELSGNQYKTDKNGTALVVLPAGSPSEKAKLTLNGYNDAEVSVAASGQKIVENNLKMTPIGRVYFLSKRTGKINIMKANLDGTDVKVVVEGTGFESDYTTSLIQSPDGKYVAMIARRAATDSAPQLYALSTDDDKLVSADSGNADFSFVGWSGDNLIYTADRRDGPMWQQGMDKLKAYDASGGRITLLDQSTGSDAQANINEAYNGTFISGNTVIFSKYWFGYRINMAGKQSSVHEINANGQNHRVVAGYDATLYNPQLNTSSPTSFFITVNNTNDYSQTDYYQFNVGGSPKKVDKDQLKDQTYRVYYFSPAGKQVLWSEVRDGKGTIILADNQGSDAKDIASATGYQAYGWHTDQYVLISKNTSELFILDAHGSTPIKVADYQSASGYGHD